MAQYIESPTKFTFIALNGAPKTVSKDHPNFEEIRELIVLEDDIASALDLLDTKQMIVKFSDGIVTITDSDDVLINGQQVADSIVDRIIRLHKAGEPFDALANFAKLLQANPNEEVREDLYKWLENGGMPLTEDGCFVAYKKVRDDYFSYHSGNNGRVYHGVGSYVAMPREECDESRYRTCSSGLHFCSFDYLKSYFGSEGKVLAVKVNPKDVTAIPEDYNLAKGRGCAYIVLSELDRETAEFAFANVEVYREPRFDEDQAYDWGHDADDYSDDYSDYVY